MLTAYHRNDGAFSNSVDPDCMPLDASDYSLHRCGSYWSRHEKTCLPGGLNSTCSASATSKNIEILLELV